MIPQLFILSGFDPTGGAGIIADVFTARDMGVFPISAPSVLTVQNSINFSSSQNIGYKYIIDAAALLFAEFSPCCAKVGLVPSGDAVWLSEIKKAVLSKIPRVVIDPVLKATACEGYSQISPEYLNFISGSNVVLTPNNIELERLALQFLPEFKAMDCEQKAIALHKLTGADIVVKFEGREGRVLVISNGCADNIIFDIIAIDRPVHGTGCRFSAAVASCLAKDMKLHESVKKSIEYMSGKIKERVAFNLSGQDYIF